jgi:hypothetical protein
MSGHVFAWDEQRAASVCSRCQQVSDVRLEDGRAVRRFLVDDAWVLEPPACFTIESAALVLGTPPALPAHAPSAAERADAAWFYDRDDEHPLVLEGFTFRDARGAVQLGAGVEALAESGTRAEMIDGAVLGHAAACVDLADFSPVLPFRDSVVPCPATLLEDGTYRLGPLDMLGNTVRASSWITADLIVGPRVLRRMRARYLLRREELLKQIDAVWPWHHQERIRRVYGLPERLPASPVDYVL